VATGADVTGKENTNSMNVIKLSVGFSHHNSNVQIRYHISQI